MTISFTNVRNEIAAFIAVIALVIGGCSETTTEDVADARTELEQEQDETAEVIREGEEDIAQAQREAYEASKPVIEEGREDVAEVKREVSEVIREQKKEELAAAAKLRTEEQKLHSKQERDSYVTEAEHRLAEIKLEIDQLEERASKAEGVENEDLDLQIKTLYAQHEMAEEAIEKLKVAEIDEWEAHERNVRMAMQDLDTRLSNYR